ncbi:HAD family hydrolase [Mailhella massiliensis]|uniref:HAD family hydrolase n=1 Tax=Mailhella massiliensis TaxID=1903261 RepID=UPI00097D56CC|nr:HAD-IA family hydrolase [Mailhella massiliensis]
MKSYDTVIFDLDGTLLDTLEDLMLSVNHALSGRTEVRRSLQEVRGFVGNGVRRLMVLSLPGGERNPQFEEAMADFRAHYAVHCRDHTRPYPQIMDMLRELKARGLKMGIVSNKPDAQVKDMNGEYFGGMFGAAMGEKEGVRRKPAPDSLLRAMEELGGTREGTLYVGDSEVDVMTAKNAGVDCLSVTWGFRDRDVLEEAGAVRFIDAPMELPALLEEKA